MGIAARGAFAGALGGMLVVVAGGALVAMAASDNPVDTAQVVGTLIALVVMIATGLGVLWRWVWMPYTRGRTSVAHFTTGSRSGLPIRLAEVELIHLGVRTPRDSSGSTRSQLPYAGRHQLDPLLERALAEKRVVLVHGPSASGKSRSTAEAARRVVGDRRVLVPDAHPEALRALLSAGAVTKRALIWLSDLERHIAAGVDAHVLERLLEIEGVTIVATIRDGEFQRIAPTGELRPQGRDVVDLAIRHGGLVRFSGWDSIDRGRAARQYAHSQPDVSAALQDGQDLGVYLVAGAELIERIEIGQPPANGVAVVRAAADWFRVGLARPAPLLLVRKLYPAYLPPDDASLLAGFESGLAWSCESVSGVRTLTQLTNESGLLVHDYVLDHWARHPPAPVPDATWVAIASELEDVDEMNTVAITALEVHGNVGAAERLFRQAIGLGDSGATFNLGVLLLRRGDKAGAELEFRSAADLGIGAAAVNLGLLLEERGDQAGAEEVLRAAADRGDSRAMYNLGVILDERGERDSAEQWLRTAASVGDAEAMTNLGTLLGARGDEEGAERWFEAGAVRGVTQAMFNLGVLLRRRGDHTGAERWYRTAAELGDADAMNSLGVVLAERGDNDGAEQCYQAAADLGNPAALTNLGVLRFGRGDIGEARRFLRAAADLGDAQAIRNLDALQNDEDRDAT